MSKITQNYIEARRDGIKWLNSQKRDYSTGVNIPVSYTHLTLPTSDLV